MYSTYKSLLVVLAIAGAVFLINFCYSPVKVSDGNRAQSTDVHSAVHPRSMLDSDTETDGALDREFFVVPAESLPWDSLKTATKGLPQDVIDKMEKFVFFIGYPRSGHSIVGSFMDAHPHMVIAHEFMLFKRFRKSSIEKGEIPLLQDKDYLFNALYRSSVRDSMMGWRSEGRDSKNYTLSVDSPWLGRYDGYISVIGDKSGGMTANMYSESPEEFVAQYEQLRKTVGIPIKVIHCIRNPYDMLATSVLYRTGSKRSVSSFKLKMRELNGTEFMNARLNSENLMKLKLNVLENQVGAVSSIIDLVGADNILELHNGELVSDPKSSLTKLCAFLEVDCSAEYIQTCSSKVFKSVSKTRDMVVWPLEVQNKIENLINKYPFFDGYSFTGE